MQALKRKSARRASHLGRCARRALLASACALAFLASPQARAGIEPSPFQDWSSAFALQGSGPLVNPLVLIGFNPQPEPPRTLPNGAPPNPIFPSTAPALVIDVPAGTPTSQGFEILFALSEALRVSAPGAPDANGSFAFELIDPANGATAFDVFLDVTSSGGGIPAPGSWTFFNPQPEPPIALTGMGAAAAGFAFNFTHFSQAQVVLQVKDSEGNLLSFTPAPEPATLALLGLGLAMLGFRRRGVSGSKPSILRKLCCCSPAGRVGNCG